MNGFDPKAEPVVIRLGDSGLIAWVSQEDEDIACFDWRAKKSGRIDLPHYYAYYRTSGNIEYFLHTMVWERMMDSDLPKGFLVDHINGDKLNCCRYNLRLATRSHNEANKKKRRSDTSSRYKGVMKIKDGRKKCWRCVITYEGKGINLGTFYSEVKAAKAYNDAARDLFQEFALINTFEDEPDGGEEEENDADPGRRYGARRTAARGEPANRTGESSWGEKNKE
jgi:hypothetical protein